MDHFWAPWRLDYIKKDKSKSPCPFCEFLDQEPNQDNLIFYKDQDLVVVMNLFPFNVGHLLVMPTHHVAQPQDLETRIWTKLAMAQVECLKILESCYKAQGFNLGLNLGTAGGAGIPAHLHWHIVPRWIGDTNFMPAIAEVKVIPSHRVTMYQELKPFFDDFAERLKTVKI